METGARAEKWHVLAFASLGHLVNDGWSAFIPVVADIAHQRQTPIPVVALMSVAFYSAAALFSFHVGRWADRTGAQGRLLTFGLAIISVTFLGFFLAFDFATQSALEVLVILFSCLAGFGTAFYHPLSGTLIRTVFPLSEGGKALGVSGAFGAIGSSTFPLLFVSLAVYLAEPGALALMAALGLVAAAVVGAGLKGRGRLVRGQEDPSRKERAAITREIVILTVVTAVRTISTAGFTFWLATYLTTVRGVGIGALLGLTISALWVGSIPGQFFFGGLVDRFDNRYVLSLGSAGAALSVLGYIYTQDVTGLLFIILFGFFSFSTFPTLLSLSSAYSSRASSSANAIVWGLGAYGGNVIGPPLVGFVIGENYGLFNEAFIFLAVLGLAGALASPFMKKPAALVEEEASRH